MISNLVLCNVILFSWHQNERGEEEGEEKTQRHDAMMRRPFDSVCPTPPQTGKEIITRIG